jgi:hypothetical protein
MSNPTISPGYGYVICSHDDPKRSHILNECSEWNQPCHGECDKCAKFPARKPVEIPDGWELVPEGEVPPREHQWYYTIDKYWCEGGTRYNSFYEAFRCTYGNANHGAFIRRKPVQPTERIKRDVWLNVYQHSEYYGYDSKDEADDCATQTRIACVRVQIDCEKGEGL